MALCWIPRRRNKRPREGSKGIARNTRKRVRVTVEEWENACSELMKEPYMIDYKRVKQISEDLGISEVTFEKYYHLWLAHGRKTEELAIIKKEDNANDDKGRDRETSERVQDLPQIKRSYKRTV